MKVIIKQHAYYGTLAEYFDKAIEEKRIFEVEPPNEYGSIKVLEDDLPSLPITSYGKPNEGWAFSSPRFEVL